MVVNGLGRCVDGELAGALPFYVNRHLVNLFLLSFNILLSGTAVDNDPNRHRTQTSILGFRISETLAKKKMKGKLKVL